MTEDRGQRTENRTFILGLGASGLSALAYCLPLNKSVEIFDSRLQPPGLSELKKHYPETPVYLGPWQPEDLLSATEIIISPGLNPLDSTLDLARSAGIPIIGDIELFARAAQAPIIAITGTNAKGTVTTLITDMIKAAGKSALMGGNIGIPALDLLAEATPDYYVLELSSFQLETTFSLHATAAVILNISEDHLDRHGSMDAYLAAKKVIFQGAQHCITNRDQPITWPAKSCYSFGQSEPACDHECGLRTVHGETFLTLGEQNLLNIQQLRIKGIHNALNALAALALGLTIDLPMPVMLNALCAFKGLEHRCQFIQEHQGITWYNDSKGTNVGATLAAINGLAAHGKIILIAGGVGKDQDFTPLIEAVARTCRIVIVIGQAGPELAVLLKDHVAIEFADSLNDAVNLANHFIKSGDSVLLSPACASFDMFKNFEDRGQQFVTLVKKLLSNTP